METPLPVFPVKPVLVKDVGRFLVKVKMDAKRILGSFGPKEYDAFVTVKLPNIGHLNRVFEQMGVPYAPHPLPGTEASQVATRKCKADMSKKAGAKKLKVVQIGKATPIKMVVKRSVVKVTPLKAMPCPKGTSRIDFILAKPIGVSKKFCLSDVLGSSWSRRDEGHRAIEIVANRAPCVISFDNVGDDSSPDFCEASPPKRVANIPLPFSYGESLSHAFANLLRILMLILQMAIFAKSLWGMQVEIWCSACDV
jgi:hypothetical protein